MQKKYDTCGCGQRKYAIAQRCATCRLSEPIGPRFWSKVVKSDGCWEWQGGRFAGPGYGRFSIKHKNTLAHRVAWELTYGPIPDGLFVCHRCDNPSCVRPGHLFLGTALDNNRDMAAKGRRADFRGRTGKPLPGEMNGAAKLRAVDVLAIRNAPSASGLAATYGVTASMIYRIRRGEAWRHLQGVAA